MSQTNPCFSVLHATYGRPAKAVQACRQWFERAANPEAVEYIFAVNNDDETKMALLVELQGESAKTGRDLQIVHSDFPGSVPAWNAAAKASTGSILIQAQDDLEPPEGWDEKLTTAIQGASSRAWEWLRPTVVAVSDGFRKDELFATAIITRARYEQQGEFLHGGYSSVFSDDEHTVRARADAEAGKCTLIDATDLVFLHRHHYHDKTIPWDATYARQNVPEKYDAGRRLFLERNAVLLKWRTWA